MFGQSFKKLSGRICRQDSRKFLYSSLGDVQNILKTHIGLDDGTVKKIVKSRGNYLIKIPSLQIVLNCELFKRLKVEWTTEENIIRCLSHRPITLEHRICLLQELGVSNITDNHIHRVPISMRMTVSRFKKLHNIPTEKRIVDIIIETIGGDGFDTNKCRPLSESANLYEYYKWYMLYYKTWHLEFRHKKLLTYKKIKYESFRVLAKLINFLDNELKIDRKILENNPYLLSISPDNASALLSEFRDIKIADKDIKYIINKWPRFLLYDVDNVKNMLKSFKKYNISDQSVLNCFDIFRLNNDVFCERMENVRKNPDLNIWLEHPRLLYLILHHKLVQDRVQYLNLLNRKKTSNLHTISSVRRFFLRHIQDETSHTAHKKFLQFLIYKELGNDTEYLLYLITRHPCWKNVGLTDIQANLLYLKQHYSKEDICQSIHVILYPVDVVRKLLEILYVEYGPEKGYNFTPAQYLALCVYMLERKNHFTGNGVWQKEFSEDLVYVSKEKENAEIPDNSVNKKFNLTVNTESTVNTENVCR